MTNSPRPVTTIGTVITADDEYQSIVRLFESRASREDYIVYTRILVSEERVLAAFSMLAGITRSLPDADVTIAEVQPYEDGLLPIVVGINLGVTHEIASYPPIAVQGYAVMAKMQTTMLDFCPSNTEPPASTEDNGGVLAVRSAIIETMRSRLDSVTG